MNCKTAQQQLERYFDDELTLSERRAMSEHLDGCPSCASLLQGLHSTRQSLLQLESHDASASFKRRLRQQLLQSGTEELDSGLVTRPGWFGMRPGTGLGMGFGSAVTAVLFIGVWLAFGILPYTATGISEDAILDAHVRSLMVDHAMDIASNDQHTVKPWFNGKLNFAPPVRQLGERGFPLMGGRLDYVAQQPFAALVYQRRAHVINLFVGVVDDSEGAADISRRGYNLISWQDNGLQFWLVSDLNKAELKTLAQLLQQGKFPATTNSG